MTAPVASAREGASAPSERLERAEAPGDEQVDGHDRDRHEGERRGQRQVARHALLLEDDVADELVVRDQARRDVVAEGQREREDRARRRGPAGRAAG